MKHNHICPEPIFNEIGRTEWSPTEDAFVVETKLGATILLSPNSDESVKFGVHIDEIEVPELLRRQGVATEAMTALCRLADKNQFKLDGGPVGWSNDPWREKFVEWLKRFGFEPDPRFAAAQIDDQMAFYVRRFPKARHGTE